MAASQVPLPLDISPVPRLPVNLLLPEAHVPGDEGGSLCPGEMH